MKRAAQRARWALILGACVQVALGCAKQQDVIVETVADRPLTNAEIDADPWALLPGGAIGWVHLDAQLMFASPFGERLLALAQQRSFILPSAGFEPKRDLANVYVGLYSMQGADFAGVARGQFDPQKIDQTADGIQKTPWGSVINKSSYAGRTVYVASDVAYAVLTPKTVLFGNQTGLRRALDRIREGRVRRRVPGWIDELLKTPGAPFALGVDFRSHPVPDAARRELGFMRGLEMARIVGNFEAPGVNLAGTLSYPDEASASAGASNVTGLADLMHNYGWLMSAVGISQPIQKLEASAEGTDARFVVAVDAQAVGTLLDQVSKWFKAGATGAGGIPLAARQPPQ